MTHFSVYQAHVTKAKFIFQNNSLFVKNADIYIESNGVFLSSFQLYENHIKNPYNP